MRTVLTCSFFLLVNAVLSIAQNQQRPYIIQVLQNRKEGGKIQVVQDVSIDHLMVKAAKANNVKGTIRGFRIKVYSDNSSNARQLTNDAKAKLIGNFPAIDTYLEVKAPNWRLYAGNYRTITDAIQVKKQLEKYFNDIIIVEADIELDKL